MAQLSRSLIGKFLIGTDGAQTSTSGGAISAVRLRQPHLQGAIQMEIKAGGIQWRRQPRHFRLRSHSGSITVSVRCRRTKEHTPCAQGFCALSRCSGISCLKLIHSPDTKLLSGGYGPCRARLVNAWELGLLQFWNLAPISLICVRHCSVIDEQGVFYVKTFGVFLAKNTNGQTKSPDNLALRADLTSATTRRQGGKVEGVVEGGKGRD